MWRQVLRGRTFLHDMTIHGHPHLGISITSFNCWILMGSREGLGTNVLSNGSAKTLAR